MPYFRPEWTCGRYNKENKVAVFYNLLEGKVYLFEDESANVIGWILKSHRNGTVSVDALVMEVGYDKDEIVCFFNQLCSLELLTMKRPTPIFISTYREKLSKNRHLVANASMDKFRKSGVLINHESVEMKYMEKCGCIFSLMLELTYNCSEKCIHCYNPGATRNDQEQSGRNNPAPLSFEDYKRIIDELNDQGLVKVCLTGGDPFSNPLAWQIIDYLWEKELAIDIFTNGQQLIGKMDKLASYYPRTMGISLYSNIPEIHDSITRVCGSHKRTLEILKECSRLAVPTQIKCCLMRQNVKTYPTVKKLARELGMTVQFDVNITDSLDGDKCASHYLRLTHNELEVVLRDIDLPYYIDGNKELDITELPSLHGKMCNAGVSSICITPDGYLQPCCAFPMKCGNVKETSIRDLMLKSDEMTDWLNHSTSQCKECWTHDYCIFCQLCPGNNYNSNRDYLTASENNCFLAKERYYLSKAMKDGYDPLNGVTVEDALANLEIEICSLRRIYD